MPPPEPRIVRTRKRRRTVALNVGPDGTLTVQAPMQVSLKWIKAFIESRAGWIEKRRAEEEAQRAVQPLALANGSRIPYLGLDLLLEIAEGAYATPVWEDKVLRLCLAPGLSPEARQAEIRTELTLWYKKQARRVFQDRLAFWAEAMGVKPGRFVLSAPERRWGSCSARNDIRLNWRLIMAGADLLDYVIVHELAHVPHKNHGPAFWRCVARAIPDCKERRKRLQNWKGENWLKG